MDWDFSLASFEAGLAKWLDDRSTNITNASVNDSLYDIVTDDLPWYDINYLEGKAALLYDKIGSYIGKDLSFKPDGLQAFADAIAQAKDDSTDVALDPIDVSAATMSRTVPVDSFAANLQELGVISEDSARKLLAVSELIQPLALISPLIGGNTKQAMFIYGLGDVMNGTFNYRNEFHQEKSYVDAMRPYLQIASFGIYKASSELVDASAEAAAELRKSWQRRYDLATEMYYNTQKGA